MNIIQAIQAAEQGKLITNNFLQTIRHFLKYMGEGVFYEYEIVDDKAVYKYEVRNFSMAEVLSAEWELVENRNYFKP